LLCYWLIPAPVVYIHTTGMAHFRKMQSAVSSQILAPINGTTWRHINGTTWRHIKTHNICGCATAHAVNGRLLTTQPRVRYTGQAHAEICGTQSGIVTDFSPSISNFSPLRTIPPTSHYSFFILWPCKSSVYFEKPTFCTKIHFKTFTYWNKLN